VIYGAGPGDKAERNLSWFDWSIANGLSSDGAMLLFHESGEATRGRYGLFLRPMDGGPPVRLSDSGLGSLSQDGKWAVAYPQETHVKKVMLIPTGMGSTEILATDPITPVGRARLLPDGETIVFGGLDPEGTHGIFRLARGGGSRPAPISIGGAEHVHRLSPAVSPDGQWLSLCSEGRIPLLAHSVSGETRPIAGALPGDDPLVWSQDGASLFVSRGARPPLEIAGIDMQNAERTVVKKLEPADPAGALILYHPQITPDGRSYAYTSAQKFSELFLVEGLR
jgi:hypothetical protein